MTRARTVALVSVAAAAALGIGFLAGYPARVGAATAIAFAAGMSVLTTRELAARARLRTRPSRRAAETPELEQLRRIDKALSAAQGSGYGVDRELRPLLRPIAGMRLARRGVDLERHPEAARAILGEQLWGLLQPDSLRGSNRVAGGVSATALDSLIDGLERI